MAHLLQVRRPARPKTPARPAYGRRQTGDERRMKKKRSRPVSRVLSGTIIPLGAASPRRSSNLPGRRVGHALCLSARPSLFGLAPDGVFRAVAVASDAVRSYRTFSPLPVPGCPGHRRFVLCGTFRRLTAPRRYLASCPAEPGLSSPILRRQRLFGRLRRRFYAVGSPRSDESPSARS